MEPYRSYYPTAGLVLPVTETLARQVLLLPTGTAVSALEIKKICDIIRLSLHHGREISAQLSALTPSRPGSAVEAGSEASIDACLDTAAEVGAYVA
jgi:hypothetical protein